MIHMLAGLLLLGATQQNLCTPDRLHPFSTLSLHDQARIMTVIEEIYVATLSGEFDIQTSDHVIIPLDKQARDISPQQKIRTITAIHNPVTDPIKLRDSLLKQIDTKSIIGPSYSGESLLKIAHAQVVIRDQIQRIGKFTSTILPCVICIIPYEQLPQSPRKQAPQPPLLPDIAQRAIDNV